MKVKRSFDKWNDWRTRSMDKQDLNYNEYVEIAERVYWVGFFLTKMQASTAIPI